MSTQQQDPIFESLDRLASLADDDIVTDRMPRIRHRVRRARQRRAAVVGVAGIAVVAGLVTWQSGMRDSSTPPATDGSIEIGQSMAVRAQAVGADHVGISFKIT